MISTKQVFSQFILHAIVLAVLCHFFFFRAHPLKSGKRFYLAFRIIYSRKRDLRGCAQVDSRHNIHPHITESHTEKKIQTNFENKGKHLSNLFTP